MERVRTPREGMRETGEMPLPGTGDDTGMATKADMADKDKYCMKNFGKKYSECSDKEKAQCDKIHGEADKDNKMKGKGCPHCKDGKVKADMCKASCMGGTKMAKAQPGFAPEKITDINPHFAADGKGDKDEKKKGKEKCPSCGCDIVDKGGCMKMGCGGKMAKAQPGFAPEKITDINPHFVAESGGQTKSGYFTTNGRTIITEDGKPKRKKLDSKIDMARLSSRQNPHSDTGVVREEKFD